MTYNLLRALNFETWFNHVYRDEETDCGKLAALDNIKYELMEQIKKGLRSKEAKFLAEVKIIGDCETYDMFEGME